MKKSRPSSARWLQEHHSDYYVKQARAQNYASRAAFKLLEMNEKDHLFKPGMQILDLGAAPGGWVQVASKCLQGKGRIVAVDLLPLTITEPGVIFIQGDFTEQAILDQVLQEFQGARIDWVLSDMAPNISGIPSVDQARSLHLAELALECAVQVLKPNGGFLIKLFQGEGIDAFLKQVKLVFKKVKIRKPPASRSRSSEFYLVAREFRQNFSSSENPGMMSE